MTQRSLVSADTMKGTGTNNMPDDFRITGVADPSVSW